MRSRKALRPSWSAAPRSPTVRVATVGAIVRRVANVLASAMKAARRPLSPPSRETKNERPTPSLHTPSQELPVLRRQRAGHRLQGRAPSAALRLRARQDRAQPHLGGVVEEAARTRPGDQARALSGAPALPHRLAGGPNHADERHPA